MGNLIKSSNKHNSRKKVKNFEKRVLTFVKCSCIMSNRRVRDKRFGKLLTGLKGTKEKSFKKTSKKFLTNPKRYDNISNVAAKQRQQRTLITEQ